MCGARGLRPGGYQSSSWTGGCGIGTGIGECRGRCSFRPCPCSLWCCAAARSSPEIHAASRCACGGISARHPPPPCSSRFNTAPPPEYPQAMGHRGQGYAQRPQAMRRPANARRGSSDSGPTAPILAISRLCVSVSVEVHGRFGNPAGHAQPALVPRASAQFTRKTLCMAKC